MAKKAKAKRKSSGGRNPIPDLDCPVIVDMRTPHPTESSCRHATAFNTLQERVTTWKAAYRKHFADGGAAKDCPQFDEKHFPNVNRGIQTVAAYNKDVDRHNADETVEFYPRYSPVLADLTHLMNAFTLRRGLTSLHPKPPSDYSEKDWGPWNLVDDDGEHTIPSGWFFDEVLPRRCHARKAESLVEDAEKNILTFGQNRYVVGDGTTVRCAPMLVWATARGNYRAGDSARKRMSIAGNKDVTDIVFRIEDRPNDGDAYVAKANWGEIKAMVFLSGQVLTAGFLFNAKNKRLTAREIRGLDVKTTGLKFKTIRQVLDGPIVGKLISRDRLWTEIQNIEGKGGIKKLRDREGRSESEDVDKTPQSRTMTNLKVTTRVTPNEAFPFGVRAAQCDMVPYIVHNSEGEFEMGIVIGDRSNIEYNVGVNDAKAEEAGEEVAEAPASKKAKATGGKKKAADDAAPPVEHDTADDKETADEKAEEVKA